MNYIHKAIKDLKPKVKDNAELKEQWDDLRYSFYTMGIPEDFEFYRDWVYKIYLKLHENETALEIKSYDRATEPKPLTTLIVTNAPAKRKLSDDAPKPDTKRARDDSLIVDIFAKYEYFVCHSKDLQNVVEHIVEKIYKNQHNIADRNQDGYFKNYPKNEIAVFFMTQIKYVWDYAKEMIEDIHIKINYHDEESLDEESKYIFGPRNNWVYFQGKSPILYEDIRRKFLFKEDVIIHKSRITVNLRTNAFKMSNVHLKPNKYHIFFIKIQNKLGGHLNVLVIDTNHQIPLVTRYEPHGNFSGSYDFGFVTDNLLKLLVKLTNIKHFEYKTFGDEKDEDEGTKTYGYQTLERAARPEKWKLKYSPPDSEERIEKSRGMCKAFCYLFLEMTFGDIEGDFEDLEYLNIKNQYFFSDMIRSYISQLLYHVETNFTAEYQKEKKKIIEKKPNLYSEPFIEN